MKSLREIEDLGIKIKYWQVVLVILIAFGYWYTYHLGRASYTKDYTTVEHACMQVRKGVDPERYQPFSYMPMELRFVCEK